MSNRRLGFVRLLADDGYYELNPRTGQPKYFVSRLTEKEGEDSVSNMTYENAPATQLLATHCAACGRPLVDALSVEFGIGPVCRQKYGLIGDPNTTEEGRDEANKVVHSIAIVQSEEAFTKGAARLLELGFVRLADVIYKRSQEWKAAQKSAALVVNAINQGSVPANEDETNIEPSIRIEEEGGWLRIWTDRKPSPDALEAWRKMPGRRWDAKSMCNVIPRSSKRALWDLLVDFYPGERAVGDKGEFVVPGDQLPF